MKLQSEKSYFAKRTANLLTLVPKLLTGKLFYLILISVLICSISLRFAFSHMVGFDEGVYAYIASQMQQGAIPYLDIFDHKPPGIYYLLYAMFIFFGASAQTLHLTAALLDVIMIVSILAFATRFFDLRKAIIAATLYSTTFLLISRYLEPDFPMAILLVWSAYFYLMSKSKHTIIYSIASGVFLAGAIYFKQPAFLMFIVFILYDFYLYLSNQQTFLQSFKRAMSMTTGVLIVALPLLVYFIYTAGPAFILDVIFFNFNYSSTNPVLERIPKLWWTLLSQFTAILVLALFALKNLNIKDERWPLFVLWTLIPFAFFHTVGEISASHLIYIALPLIFVGLIGLENITMQTQTLAKLLILVAVVAPLFTISAVIYDEYRASELETQQEIAEFIKQNTNDTEQIFSDEPGYAFLAGKQNNYRITYIAPSTANFFNFSDFPEYARKSKFLVLTHRQNLLPQEFISCVHKSWKLEEKYENLGESYVSIWRNTGEC